MIVTVSHPAGGDGWLQAYSFFHGNGYGVLQPARYSAGRVAVKVTGCRQRGQLCQQTLFVTRESGLKRDDIGTVVIPKDAARQVQSLDELPKFLSAGRPVLRCYVSRRERILVLA